jgi:hypothetical protein
MPSATRRTGYAVPQPATRKSGGEFIKASPKTQKLNQLMDAHALINRVSGQMVLSFKHGPSFDDLANWAKMLRGVADDLDPRH